MLPENGRSNDLSRAADQLGLTLNEIQIGQLLGHLNLLAQWNKAFNLTAIRDPVEMLHQHLFDSLAALPALSRWICDDSTTILDVGSGAGFPGLTFAAALPASAIICVDSVGKKVGFIRQVIAESGLGNASAHHSRVEQLQSVGADVITARAFASLADFTKLTRKHLSSKGVWMAMKGKHPGAEISELGPEIEVFHVEQLRVPDMASERCLVWMRPTSRD